MRQRDTERYRERERMGGRRDHRTPTQRGRENSYFCILQRIEIKL